MSKIVLNCLVRAIASSLDKLCLLLPLSFEQQLPAARSTRLLWFGGYPSHYMGDLHCRLEEQHQGLFFVYVPFGSKGRAFNHEETSLPSSRELLPRAFSAFRTWQFLTRICPDAVLITGNFPRANLVAAAWAVMHSHDLYYLADSNPLDRRNLHRGTFYNVILRWVLRQTRKILCIGTRNAEFYLQHIEKDQISQKLLQFPLPHQNEKFESIAGRYGGPFIFLVLGRLEAIKAVDRVIDAFDLLEHSAPGKSRLLIAGDGNARSSLETQVSALGLKEKIDFLGSVPSDHAPEVFARSNAVIIASHDEPWALVVNEAMSAGKPVIGPFWIGAFADLLVSHKTGIATFGNSPKQLAAAMQYFIENPEKVGEMGKNARDHVRENGWTVENSLKAFTHLLHDVGRQR